MLYIYVGYIRRKKILNNYWSFITLCTVVVHKYVLIWEWKGRDDGICDEITLNKLPEATFALGWNNNNVCSTCIIETFARRIKLLIFFFIIHTREIKNFQIIFKRGKKAITKLNYLAYRKSELTKLSIYNFSNTKCCFSTNCFSSNSNSNL